MCIELSSKRAAVVVVAVASGSAIRGFVNPLLAQRRARRLSIRGLTFVIAVVVRWLDIGASFVVTWFRRRAVHMDGYVGSGFCGIFVAVHF